MCLFKHGSNPAEMSESSQSLKVSKGYCKVMALVKDVQIMARGLDSACKAVFLGL